MILFYDFWAKFPVIYTGNYGAISQNINDKISKTTNCAELFFKFLSEQLTDDPTEDA